MGVEARVVQQRGGAPQPRRDEDVARRLRPAGRGRAPRQPPGPRREPVLGLHLLAGQVALAVQHRLRLARRAGGEGDEARVLGPSSTAGTGSAAVSSAPGTTRTSASGRRLAEHAEVALVAHDQPRLGDREPGAQVGRAQLLGARQHDGADPEAREHRQHPLGPVADERHHDVPAATPRAASAPAARADASATSPKLHSPREPSRAERDERPRARAGRRRRRRGRSSSRRADLDTWGPDPVSRCGYRPMWRS